MIIANLVFVKKGRKIMFGNKLAKIEKMAQKGDAHHLKELVKDRKPEVRLAAIDALGQCSGEEAFNTLTLLINTPDAEERAHVVRAMAATKQPKVRAFLEHRKDLEKDPKVLAAIHESLLTAKSSD